MNKLTPVIEKYLTLRYRGINCFQNETFCNDINNIYNTLCYISDNGGEVEVSPKSESYKKFYEYLGETELTLRKNIFPTLERIGLIERKGLIWDKIRLTPISYEIIELSDDEDIEESIRNSFRTLLKDTEFGEAIYRMKKLIEIWGKITWWEIWFCIRIDINFDVIKEDVKSIRSLYRMKTVNKTDLEKITEDFDAHEISKGEMNPWINSIAVKNNGTIDLNNLRNKISNGLGTKLAHYGLRADNTASLFTVDLQQSRNSRKVSRNYKRTSDILIMGNISDYDYHHIVPFDNSHFNPDLHKEIDHINNLIPITHDDHKKFPNKSNHYLILDVSNNKIKFKSIHDTSKFIEIEEIRHLNIDRISEAYVPYNKILVNKITKKALL